MEGSYWHTYTDKEDDQVVKTAHMYQEVQLPDKVQASIENDNMKITGPNGELTRRFFHPRLELKCQKDQVTLSCELPRKRERALFGTWLSHLENMVKGVTEGFEYTLKIVYSHFPIKTSVKGDQVFIENFLGEKNPRKANILGDVKVVVKGDTITVSGNNIEDVGQTSANIELGTKIKNYDPRVFQDGIYLVSKGEEE